MDLKKAQNAAVKAARAVGVLMRANLLADKTVDSSSQHDIKLELDVRSQHLIEKSLRSSFPSTALLGEEGISGNAEAAERWVVDPIDGTVNFTYGIPHACISIALQRRLPASSRRMEKHSTDANRGSIYEDGYETVMGVVYDPFCDELWTAVQGQPARLNGKIIHVSRRRKMDECIVSIGFAKTHKSLEATLPYFNQLVHRVRKIRMMGAAALGLTYVATGRFDAYIERGIRLWDIAAGGFIIERAGGEFWRRAIPGDYAYRMIASNGLLRRTLRVPN
jgi:myo-inositol-1(or 4)-monophosphatase